MARPTGLLRLIQETHTEQKKRQTKKSLSVSTEQAEHRKRKEHARSVARGKAAKHARAVARSQRRGLYGLHKKITAP